jgi:septum formation protein
MGYELILASGSPRRRELLEQIGVPHRPLPVSLEERRRPGEPADAYVVRLALDKARAGRAVLARQRGQPERAVVLGVLGADTAVVLDGEVLGKPRDAEHGRAMLERLSGREHRVYSGVALVVGAREATRLSVSRVRFKSLSTRELHAYQALGEGLDKAGGYAIQGRAALFVSDLRGSYSGVMGLPLYETGELLRETGLYSLL